MNPRPLKWTLLIASCVMALVVCVALAPVPAAAQVTITGTDVEMRWTEPTASVDGSELHDLASTSGFYEIPGGTETLCERVAASSPQGGGEIVGHCTVPVGENTEADVRFRVRATDITGNIGPASSPDVVKRIDHLPPAAPSMPQ